MLDWLSTVHGSKYNYFFYIIISFKTYLEIQNAKSIGMKYSKFELWDQFILWLSQWSLDLHPHNVRNLGQEEANPGNEDGLHKVLDGLRGLRGLKLGALGVGGGLARLVPHHAKGGPCQNWNDIFCAHKYIF